MGRTGGDSPASSRPAVWQAKRPLAVGSSVLFTTVVWTLTGLFLVNRRLEPEGETVAQDLFEAFAEDENLEWREWDYPGSVVGDSPTGLPAVKGDFYSPIYDPCRRFGKHGFTVRMRQAQRHGAPMPPALSRGFSLGGRPLVLAGRIAGVAGA